MFRKFVVKEVLDYGQYRLVDEREREEVLSFQFYELPVLTNGDEIYFDEKLADKTSLEFTQPYSFIKSSEEEILSLSVPREEVGGIKCKGETFFIRRIFG